MAFFADHQAGASEGVAPPAAWHVEYLPLAVRGGGESFWTAVSNTSAYSLDVTDTAVEIGFDEIETTAVGCLSRIPE